ncbi:MAG: hypothetical protein N2Z72_01600 [Bacteroidales bacterium]|nr:hypothetical protein [Bacteroidales bacterium]
MNLSKKLLIWLVGFLVGGVLGYVYYINWGCTSSCSITSTPFKSVAFGGILGALIADFFIPRNKSKS